MSKKLSLELNCTNLKNQIIVNGDFIFLTVTIHQFSNALKLYTK